MELLRSLAALAEPPGRETPRIADLLGLGTPPASADYDDLFLFQLYPYASVYLGPEGMLGGEARDRIAGFWRVLEQAPPPESDHLALVLALYARLCELESEAPNDATKHRWRHLRTTCLWEHIASWVPAYLEKLQELASPFYQAWGELLREVLEQEVLELGQQELLPLHLREAPAVLDPEAEGGEAWLDSLLSPVRSGIILVRNDLVRAGRDLQLATRVAERRYALKALLGQDPAATLDWLAAEAEAWQNRHQRWNDLSGPITDFWSHRAATTARRLHTARQEL
ncbi:MAG: molecular chaperone TorD family protein [Thermoanaerobaculia bacterium]